MLLFDRRGQGESEGDPHGFGWEGEKDIKAAIAFLQRRPDVDPERIGGLGLSVGGELMLQAAAETDALKAVVSEGAGSRSVGEFREMPGAPIPMHAVETMITAGLTLFSNSPPPPLMQDIIGRIAPRPVFLIWATHGVDTEVLNERVLQGGRGAQDAVGDPRRPGTSAGSRRGRRSTSGAWSASSTGRYSTARILESAGWDLLAQQGDELTRVVHDEVGAEFDRGLARDRGPELAAGDDVRLRAQRGECAEHLGDAVEHAGGRGRERDQVGLLGFDQRHQIAGGRARAEQQRLPAVGLEEVGDHPRAQHVLLLGRAGDDRQPPVARRARQLAAERVEDRLRDGGGVVLLGDVQRAHRPPVPDLAQRGLEHAEVDVRHRRAGVERVFDDTPGARGVAAQQRVEERVAMVFEPHRGQDATPRQRPCSEGSRPFRFGQREPPERDPPVGASRGGCTRG